MSNKKVSVLITGTYSNGHTYDRIVAVDGPEDDDLSEWFEDKVFPETGDGVPDVPASHLAVVCPGQGELSGKHYGWDG